MTDSTKPVSAIPLPPPPQTGTAPGLPDPGPPGTNNGHSSTHMPPPPLPPVAIPPNNGSVPVAMSSPFQSGIPAHGSPSAAGNGGVRRVAPEPNKRALYVGGLDPRVGEDLLRQIFETSGHVVGIKIIPDKHFQNKGFNYGFVEYDDPGAAEHAMQQLSNRKIMDQEIRVNWAYQTGTSSKEDTSHHYHIFVGDLSNEVNDEVLTQAFSAFGEVSEARVMWDMKTGRSRGYGFVAYRDRNDAEKALSSMDGEWLGSRAIRCNWANQKGQPSIHQQQAMAAMGMSPATPFSGHHQYPTQGVQSYEMIVAQTPSWQTTCYVGNLTPYTTQNDLVPLFQNFGYVVETRFQSDRGFAFIKMDSHENAAMAICQLSGYNVNGRPLKCSWGKDRPPTGQFDPYSAGGQPQTPSYGQPSPAYGFPQYGGGPMSPHAGSPMSPPGHGGPHGASMGGHAMGQMGGHGPSPSGAPLGPGGAGRGYPQSQAGYSPAPSYSHHGYNNVPMPGSAGGYGSEQNSAGGWPSHQSHGSYGRGGPAGNSSGNNNQYGQY